MDNEILTNNGMEFHPIYCPCERCKAMRALRALDRDGHISLDTDNRVTLE